MRVVWGFESGRYPVARCDLQCSALSPDPISLSLGSLLGGVDIIDTPFQTSIGKMLIGVAAKRDYPLIQGRSSLLQLGS